MPIDEDSVMEIITNTKRGLQAVLDKTRDEFTKVIYKYDTLPSTAPLHQLAYLTENEFDENGDITYNKDHLYIANENLTDPDTVTWNDLGKVINDPPPLAYFVGTRTEWDNYTDKQPMLVYITDEDKLFFWEDPDLVQLNGDNPVFIGTKDNYENIIDADLLKQLKLVYFTEERMFYARINKGTEVNPNYVLEPIDNTPHFIGALSEWNNLTNAEKSNYKIVLITDNDIEDPDLQYRIPVGVIQAYIGTTAPNHWLICDGSEFDETIFPKLYELLGDNHTPDLRSTYLAGSDDEVLINQITAEGLPNITGRTNHMVSGNGPWNNGATYTNGALTAYGVHSAQAGTAETSWSGRQLIGQIAMNAANSNPIYGNSTHVRPKTYGVNYIIRAN